MSIKIRALEPQDFPAWLPLWDGNNLGQRDEAVTTETWTRLLDVTSHVNGLAAFEGEDMVGLLHYVTHHTTGYIAPVCYMQDVFVDPAYRKKGIAQTLVEVLIKKGKAEKWARIHWFAENNNAAAQALYKNIGSKLDFSLFILPING